GIDSSNYGTVIAVHNCVVKVENERNRETYCNMKIKVIKKGFVKKENVSISDENRTRRVAAREMVANVSNWVNDLQDRKREEARMGFDNLFRKRPQTT
ncbi:MAG: hypothetical protein ACJ72Z_03200, partial [Pyrinomonadaceae bacterium]